MGQMDLPTGFCWRPPGVFVLVHQPGGDPAAARPGGLSPEWLLAALDSIAQHGAALLARIFRPSGGQAVRVRLCRRGWAEELEFSRDLPHCEGSAGGPACCWSDSDLAPMWPAYLEKAVAHLMGGYAELAARHSGGAQSSMVAAALRTLTGCAARSYGAGGGGDALFARVRGWLDQGSAVSMSVAAGAPTPDDAGDLVPGRSYAVLGTKEEDEKRAVQLSSIWQGELVGDALWAGSSAAAECSGFRATVAWFSWAAFCSKAEALTVARLRPWPQQVRARGCFVPRQAEHTAPPDELCCVLLWLSADADVDAALELDEGGAGAGDSGAFILSPAPVEGRYRLEGSVGLVPSVGAVREGSRRVLRPTCGRPVIVAPFLARDSGGGASFTISVLVSGGCAAARRCAMPPAVHRACLHLAATQWGDRSELAPSVYAHLWACGGVAAASFRNSSRDDFKLTCDLSRSPFRFGPTALAVPTASADAFAHSDGFIGEATTAESAPPPPQVEWGFSSEPAAAPRAGVLRPDAPCEVDLPVAGFCSAPGDVQFEGLASDGGDFPAWATGWRRGSPALPVCSAEERALRRLREEGEAMQRDRPPRPLSAPVRATVSPAPSSPVPQRAGRVQPRCTSAGPERQQGAGSIPRTRPGSPGSCGGDSVFSRLSRLPAPVRHKPLGQIPRNVRGRLTRGEQDRRTEWLYRESRLQRQIKMERLERRVYGNPAAEHTISKEDMENSIARLHAQEMKERKDRRERLREKYLSEGKQKALTREDQGEVVKRLFDTAARERELSEKLNERHNKAAIERRKYKARSAVEWRDTIERLYKTR
eukprot:TRINITY_DN3656_c0_g1_i1.p1 TRINITY_DN3656_c0_g1~~TRINITY_DN3656_c0_g1_i1.p1  ORF type:complete len:821 (+),score=162.77 TRINITY_DN3656_c0_g1_i1:70-2532(+)